MAFKFTSHVPLVNSKVDQAFQRACEIIGGMAESYAKGLAPVKTGTLRDSITHESDGNTVVIGTDVKYAPYQELGAPNAHVPAHPYLRPAVENHVDEYVNVIRTELSKI